MQKPKGARVSKRRPWPVNDERNAVLSEDQSVHAQECRCAQFAEQALDREACVVARAPRALQVQNLLGHLRGIGVSIMLKVQF